MGESIEERPPIATAALSVVLTVVEGENDAESALRAWVLFLNGLDRAYEILLVSEGSRVRPAKLEALAAQCAHVHFLPDCPQLGFGDALRRGIEAARHPLLFYARCNSQYKPADINQLLKSIDLFDLVTGFRVRSGQRRNWRRLVYRWFARALFGIRLRDVGCLFLLVRRSFFPRMPIQSAGMFAHVEVLAKANFLGCIMAEVPLNPRQEARAETEENIFSSRTAADAWRVLRHPDFGPAVLPEQFVPFTK